MGRVWPSKGIVVGYTPVFIYANLGQSMTIQSVGLHQHDFAVIPQSQVAKEMNQTASQIRVPYCGPWICNTLASGASFHLSLCRGKIRQQHENVTFDVMYIQHVSARSQ